MATCPICKGPAEQIDEGKFDGMGFDCQAHGKFWVADSVFGELKQRTREQWEKALTIAAARRAKDGQPPLIMTYDF